MANTPGSDPEVMGSKGGDLRIFAKIRKNRKNPEKSDLGVQGGCRVGPAVACGVASGVACGVACAVACGFRSGPTAACRPRLGGSFSRFSNFSAVGKAVGESSALPILLWIWSIPRICWIFSVHELLNQKIVRSKRFYYSFFCIFLLNFAVLKPNLDEIFSEFRQNF